MFKIILVYNGYAIGYVLADGLKNPCGCGYG
jgi:hypothetical protein